MNITSLILASFAGFTFFASAIQALIAWLAADPKVQKRLRLPIIGCIASTIILIFASYDSSSTQTPSQPSTHSSSPTAISTSTSSAPTPSPTLQSTTPILAPSSMITENKLLTCSTCSGGDPIYFIINSITIDTSNGRTLWNINLVNISGNGYKVYNDGISLTQTTSLSYH